MQSSGKIDQVGARVAGAADPLGDLRRVAVDVADGGVDLGERNRESCGGFVHWQHSMFRRLKDIAKLVGASAALVAGVGALAMAVPAYAQQAPVAPTPTAGLRGARDGRAGARPRAAARGGRGAGRATRAPPSTASRQPTPSLATARVAGRTGCSPGRRTASADRFGDGYPSAAPIATAESPHFCFYWVSDPASRRPRARRPQRDHRRRRGPGLRRGDDRDRRALLLDRGGAGPARLGAPKPDAEGCGDDPGARSDIYLKQIGTEGLFGYESPDPGQGRARSQYGYLVLDDDYSPEEFPGFADPTVPASVTFAHEFNHLLQQNYDSFQDLWMFESTAVWAEQKVYPQINDYINYVRAFARFPGAPLTATYPPDRRKSLKIYGSAVFNHWLDAGGGGYGSEVIRGAWEDSDRVKPRDYSLAAYDTAIAAAGGRSFSREFASFATATAEWRTGLGNFPDHAMYPDVMRKRLAPACSPTRTFSSPTRRTACSGRAGTLEHEDQAPPTGRPGVRSAVGLVGRDGTRSTARVTRGSGSSTTAGAPRSRLGPIHGATTESPR